MFGLPSSYLGYNVDGRFKFDIANVDPGKCRKTSAGRNELETSAHVFNV